MKKSAKKSKTLASKPKASVKSKPVIAKKVKKQGKSAKLVAKTPSKNPSKSLTKNPSKTQIKSLAKADTKITQNKKVSPQLSVSKVPAVGISAKGASKEEKKAQVLAQIAAAQKEPVVEAVLTNAEGKLYCKAHDCDQAQTTEGYCRLHYIALWKRNRSKVKILEGSKLDKYIEDLTSKYPDKYLEMLRKDLSNEKDFNLIISEMDMEDSGDDADSEEDTSRFIEEVRGGVPTTDDDDGGF
jgi:hypothetical protein